jgi:DNA-binding transcriptional LysR family regulator
MSRTFDPMQLGSIEMFCKAAEASSFTAAALALGVTPAAVSRSVGRLEQRLGVTLFARSTRQIRLSDDGRAYHEQCTQALHQIAEAGRAVTGQQGEPSGTLRISAPTTYAHPRLFKLLPSFMAAFPNIKVDISVSSRNVDFVDEGFDVAIRLGTPADSRLVARKLEDASLGVFASPHYLRAHGTPQSLADLKAHHEIGFVRPSTGKQLPWLFRDHGQDVEHMPNASIAVMDDPLGCVHHAANGGGLVQTYHFVVADMLAQGILVEVLQSRAGRSRPFSILYPYNRHLSARVRAWVDFVVAWLSTHGRHESLR